MSGCYPGCFYYTDSCFRQDCKLGQPTFTARKPQMETTMYLWKLIHRSGFVKFQTLDAAMVEYNRRTRGGHTAFLKAI